MRRSFLGTLVVLGSIISLIGSTGLFAALTDTAQTGTNTVDSAGLPVSADIQLAAATSYNFPAPCGTYSDNLTTGFITASGLEPGGNSGSAILFCIKSAGSQPVALSVRVIPETLTDLDTDCTGDEADYDTTCGGDAAGELSTVLNAPIRPVDCASGSDLGGGVDSTLASLATSPEALGANLAVGAIGCYYTFGEYPVPGDTDAAQAAQSDTVTWQFEFTGTATP
ncbi:MAG: hypothetical protein WEC75_07655 [Dehalococcoidia bacterium]